MAVGQRPALGEVVQPVEGAGPRAPVRGALERRCGHRIGTCFLRVEMEGDLGRDLSVELRRVERSQRRERRRRLSAIEDDELTLIQRADPPAMRLDGLPAAGGDLVGEAHRPLDEADVRGVAEGAARRTEPGVLERGLAGPERAGLVLTAGGDELAHGIREWTRSEGRGERPRLAAVEPLVAKVLERRRQAAGEVGGEVALGRLALIGPGGHEGRRSRVDAGAGIDPHGDR